MLIPTLAFSPRSTEAFLKNETRRAAISSIMDDIEQTHRGLGCDFSQPEDKEAGKIIRRIERRLKSLDIYREREKGLDHADAKLP